jgi:hypothetical protein
VQVVAVQSCQGRLGEPVRLLLDRTLEAVQRGAGRIEQLRAGVPVYVGAGDLVPLRDQLADRPVPGRPLQPEQRSLGRRLVGRPAGRRPSPLADVQRLVGVLQACAPSLAPARR